MWRPTHKNSGRAQDTLITDEEKVVWETHPLTKNLYRYVWEEQKAPPKIDIVEPFESKKYQAPKVPEIPIEPETQPKSAAPRKRGRRKTKA